MCVRDSFNNKHCVDNITIYYMYNLLYTYMFIWRTAIYYVQGGRWDGGLGKAEGWTDGDIDSCILFYDREEGYE